MLMFKVNDCLVYVVVFYTCAVPPVLIEGPNDRNVIKGRNVSFHCIAEADPIHGIQWYSEEGLIRVDSFINKYLLTNDASRLLILDVDLTDAGLYTCVVTNVHGTLNATATLHVQGKCSTEKL